MLGQGAGCLLESAGGFETSAVGYDVDVCARIRTLQPHLVLLPLCRSDNEGLDVCLRIRQGSDVPIVICSPNNREKDIVRALAAGADDYLVIPMRLAEFTARLRAALRMPTDWQGSEAEQNSLVVGEFEIRLYEPRAYRRGEQIDLTPIEYRLLASLMRHAGRPVSHSRLLSEVWGPEYADARNYLRLYIGYLRAKIEDDPRNPTSVRNQWGFGYRFEPSGSSPNREPVASTPADAPSAPVSTTRLRAAMLSS
jgi:two-component system KDP operon response regulator KdpE